MHNFWAAAKPRADEDERTILYVGRSDPYKNITTLIKALTPIQRLCPFPVRVLLAGAPDPRYPEGEAIAELEGVSDRVTWTGYLHDEELVKVYQDADLLVHPSRYEGFGLQIAEAMATDTPVICSRAGALSEVAGDAALRFDYWNSSELAAHAAYVLQNPDVAKEMVEAGRRQVKSFTWDRAAEETLAVYRSVAAGKQ